MTDPLINNIFWSDLDDSLRIASTGELKTDINEDSVRCSIRNILGTMLGERIFLCSFGSRLIDLVFEPINENLLNRFSDTIKQTIEAWDNRVIVAGVDFKLDQDNNQVSIAVRFQIKSYSEVFSTTVTVNK